MALRTIPAPARAHQMVMTVARIARIESERSVS